MEDHEGAPVRLEGAKGAVQLVAIGDAATEVGRHRRVKRRELDLDGAALAATHEVEARVDEQTMDPGVEPLHVAQRGQVAPGPDEGLLDRVPCELGVPEVRRAAASRRAMAALTSVAKAS